MSVFIIAEAGVNHGGSLNEALRLVEAAKACGADAVKFQMFDADRLGRPEIKHLELSAEELERIRMECDRIGIEFMCTPFDKASLLWLAPRVKRMKIASGFVTNLPFLREAAQLDMPIIFSTGMATEFEVIEASRILPRSAKRLLCTSAYPCPLEDVNLRALSWHDGLSDHTQGIHIALAAVGMGAQIIEKHLTRDRNADGPDHEASILPVEFAEMVRCIRDIEIAMGDGVKRIMPSEAKAMRIWRP